MVIFCEILSSIKELEVLIGEQWCVGIVRNQKIILRKVYGLLKRIKDWRITFLEMAMDVGVKFQWKPVSLINFIMYNDWKKKKVWHFDSNMLFDWFIGLQRNGKSCRLRWINYLRPGLKRGIFSTEEEKIVINLHTLLGNK